MAFDTRLGTRGKPSKRAPSRIAPTSRSAGETPVARAMQARARTSTLSSLASGGSTHAQHALDRRTTKMERAQALLRRAAQASHVSGLDSEQNHVLAQILRSGQHSHASKQALLSAVETGLVESNLKNLPGGDADSAGWRQERASIYPNPTNVKASAGRYFSEAKAAGPHPTAGQLAADVQRPAEQYRGRYDEDQGRAKQLLARARAKKVPAPKIDKAHRTLTKLGVSARPTKGPAGPDPFKKAAAKSAGIRHPAKIINPKWDPNSDGHGETFLAKGISPVVREWAKKYDITVGEAKADSGHVSPGHLVTGTATDVYPRQNTDAGWNKLEEGIGVLARQGFEVGYDGSVPGTQAWSGHGRGNHAHIEWVGQGSSENAIQKLGHLTAGQVHQMERGAGGPIGASGLGSGAVSTIAKASGTTKAAAAKTLKGMSVKQRFAALYKALRSSGSALGAGASTSAGGAARGTSPTPARPYSAPNRSGSLGLN